MIFAVDIHCRREYEALKVLISVVLGLAALACTVIAFAHFLKVGLGRMKDVGAPELICDGMSIAIREKRISIFRPASQPAQYKSSPMQKRRRGSDCRELEYTQQTAAAFGFGRETKLDAGWFRSHLSPSPSSQRSGIKKKV
jgi:hypothetical protein